MHFCVLFISYFPILLTLGVPVKQSGTQLTDVIEQLNRIELLLNNSVSQLLTKIDKNTNNIINSIKSMQNSQADSKFLYSIILFKKTRFFFIIRFEETGYFTSECTFNY